MTDTTFIGRGHKSPNVPRDTPSGSSLAYTSHTGQQKYVNEAIDVPAGGVEPAVVIEGNRATRWYRLQNTGEDIVWLHFGKQSAFVGPGTDAENNIQRMKHKKPSIGNNNAVGRGIPLYPCGRPFIPEPEMIRATVYAYSEKGSRVSYSIISA